MNLVLVHGAGSGPWVFDDWRPPDDRMSVLAVDLHEGLDVASASMDDYARVLRDFCSGVPAPVALCGWSMGGLVAMMASPAVAPAALVLLEPSAPAEVQGTAAVPDATGAFDAEEVYGSFPAGIRARAESLRARADRKGGIPVPALPSRSLVVYGDEFAEERGRSIESRYGIDGACFPGLDHWDLVLHPDVRQRVFDYVLEED